MKSIMQKLEHLGNECICSFTFSILISTYRSQKDGHIVTRSMIFAFANTNFAKEKSFSVALNPLY